MFYRLKFIFLAPLALACFNTFGQAPEQIFKEGEAAYRSGNFMLSIEKYENVLKDGVHSPEIYYDLGNTYFKLNQTGKAILFYERAALLSPNDEDVRHNLRVARAKITDDAEPTQSFILFRWFHSAKTLVPLNAWTYMALLFLWSSAIGIALWLTGSQRRLRKRGFISGMVFLGLSLFPFALAYAAYEAQKNSGAGIIIVSQTALKSAPDEAGKTTFTLHEGVKVSLLDKIGSWYKVKLANGDVGWTAESALEKI